MAVPQGDPAAPAPLAAVDGPGGEVVEPNRAQHHQHQDRLAPGVEGQGQHQQHEVLGRHAPRGEIERDRQGQEDEQERRGREDHARPGIE